MPRVWMVGAVTALSVLGAATGARAAVTQPPVPVDPSPINGEAYYLINQAAGLQVDTSGTQNVAATARSFTSLSQRWALTKAPSGNWRISNVGNGMCLQAAPSNGTAQAKCAPTTPAQEWTFSYVTNGYSTIKSVSTNLVLDVDGTKLVQAAAATPPTQTQLWLPRPSYFLGNDSTLLGKSEYARAFVNNANAPWWHDGYLPGQDVLQIFKNNGLNMIRIRPASINTTVTYDGVSFPITTAPYNNYTLAPPPATQIIPASSNSASPGGTSSGNHAQTDWSAIDLAKRAKRLGMAVNLTFFYSGDNTAETPGNWAGKTVDEIAGTTDPKQSLMYKYIKQEMEMYRAMGAWPDLVAIGNEVNTGMFNTTGANGLSPSGTNCTPNATGGSTGSANCFPRIEKAAMQAIADAAAETSNPAVLGPPLPPPLTCIHIDGNPDLLRFFSGATITNGIPLDIICKSYYPGWHGPLTKTQQDWHACNVLTSCGSTVQHIAEDEFATEANGLGMPIFTIEDGVSYTTQGSPRDPWYGGTPPGPSKNLSRQGMIDLIKVEKNIPNNLAMGMEWWAGEGTPIPGTPAIQGFWATTGITLFDSSTTAGNAGNNAVLPSMAAMGGRLDPTAAYRLVSAANGQVLQTANASTASGATLGTVPDTGITGLHQQWQFKAQGADPHQNAAVFPAPMDHRGDGFFQISNMNETGGVNVLEAGASDVVQNPQSAGVFAITGTNANQEWDILSAGNCGDIPADCAAPPLVGNGDGNYYVIANKATGKVLALSADGTRVEQQSPAAASNTNWIEPANKGQLWRISTARITQAIIATTTSLAGPGATAEYGNPVTFTATIAGGSPVAGSTVTFTDGASTLGTVTLAAGQTVASFTTSSLSGGAHSIVAAFSGDAINAPSISAPATLTVSKTAAQNGTVGGTVPATLALTLGPPASFGAFTPGVARVYEASTTADVVSTAGDATLSVSEPGHLTNGAFALPQPLQVLGVPKTYAAPTSHDVVAIGFRQPIAATDAVRTGTYSTTLVFTLSTTTP